MQTNKWNSVLYVALFVGGVMSLFASSFPDGLERVADRQGFLEKGRALFAAPFSGYTVPGIDNEMLATSFSGITGVFLLSVVLFFLGKFLFRIKSVQ